MTRRKDRGGRGSVGRGVVFLGTAFASLAMVACASDEHTEHVPGPSVAEAAVRTAAVPEDHRDGEALFVVNCSTCHGDRALGSDKGPPLIHSFYEPGHHADAAFQLAVSRGVQSHHWQFGDMAPLPDVSSEMVEEIIGYVRFLQRTAGIGA